MDAIKIRGLVKKYGDFTAVNGIDLTVKEGEIFALLGENGAGKTTTLKVLSSLMPFDKGEITVCGKDVKTDKSVKNSINLSPQETAVAGNLTVRENLCLIASLYGLTNTNELIKKFETEFNLVEVSNKRAKTLSGGMQRRLSLAMALITNPKVLFLDEPTLGLDVRSRRDLWKTVLNLKGKVTVILTTHYIEEAEALSDKLAVMSKGKILFTGTAKELKEFSGKDDIEDAFLTVLGDTL